MAVVDKVKEIFNSVLDITADEIKPDEAMDQSLGIDSTEMVELAVALKKEFNLDVDTKEIKKGFTFNQLVEFLTSKGAN